MIGTDEHFEEDILLLTQHLTIDWALKGMRSDTAKIQAMLDMAGVPEFDGDVVNRVTYACAWLCKINLREKLEQAADYDPEYEPIF